jgi:glyoxylase-like metal-dependent hydrolase (beta-lactamase superfamily II)
MQVSRPTPDVTSFTDCAPIPTVGFLPVNAYLLHAKQPLLVDTGMRVTSPQLLDALWSVIDPHDLRWIYLTHPDRDHTGSLRAIVDAAPNARIITTFMGMGILGLDFDIPPDRTYLLNPGQSLNLGDRSIVPFRPPAFDSPATTGFIDTSTGACFCSDLFGAPMSDEALVYTSDIRDIPSDELRAAQRLWTTVDSPWVTSADPAAFRACVATLSDAAPSVVLSSHLPPARDSLATLSDTLVSVVGSEPYVGPDQQALEELLATFEPTASVVAQS